MGNNMYNSLLVLAYPSTGSGQAYENSLHQFAALVSIRFVFAKLVAETQLTTHNHVVLI
jgi:hypothetical protein